VGDAIYISFSGASSSTGAVLIGVGRFCIFERRFRLNIMKRRTANPKTKIALPTAMPAIAPADSLWEFDGALSPGRLIATMCDFEPVVQVH